MVLFYYLQFTQPLPPSSFEKHLNSFPYEIRNRIKAFRRWQDAHTSLFGKLLLVQGLRTFNIDASLSNLRYSKYNRPYIECAPIDFNISHSGNSVVCALSDEGVIGVDIEEIQPIELADFRQQFQPKEWNAIIHSSSAINKFFTYWTQKEAAIKADGRGLHIPLNNVFVDEGRVYVENKIYHTAEINLNVTTKCYLAAATNVSCIRMNTINEYTTLSG